MHTTKLLFEIFEKDEGGFVAGCYQERIFAEESTLEDLCSSIERAVEARWQGKDSQKPSAKDIQFLIHGDKQSLLESLNQEG
jgi:hypothetical protein